MSEVSEGPGWWIASDGKWYPPELHPSRPQPAPPPLVVGPPGPGPAPEATAPGPADEGFHVGAGAAPKFFVPPIVPDLAPGQPEATPDQVAPPPQAPPPLAPSPQPLAPQAPSNRPLVAVAGLPQTRHGANASPWESESPYSSSHQNQPTARSTASTSVLKATVDPRGAFVAVASLLLVGACFLPYYRLYSPRGVLTVSFTVIDHSFGQWRLAIVVVSALCVVIGIVNSALRVGMSGAVTVFFAIRVLVLCQLGLWIAALVDRTWHGGALATGATIKLTWVAYAAVVLAVVALGGALASIGKR